MLYFVRQNPATFHNDCCYSIVTRPPSTGIIYPEIALSADQKVKLVDLRPSAEPYRFVAVRVFPPSLLKSNLQKAIRRRHIEEAYVTAKHFLAQDASELLRRLPIIMCEDAMLDLTPFVDIVWLMAAVSKGYRLTTEDCNRVMSFVDTCLHAPARYNIHVSAPSVPAEDIMGPLDLAFALRIAYGGMKCDTEFMERLLNRIYANDLSCIYMSRSLNYETIGAFDVERHIIPEAIDFHCFPSMSKETGVSQAAIWYNRSAINWRPFTGLGAKEGAANEEAGRTSSPLSETDNAAIDAFVERTLAGIRGRAPPVAAPRQMRLTTFMCR
jgi:hypothetical protein